METVQPGETAAPVIHSFVIRIWLEEDRSVTGKEVWRGHITHIPGGEQKYMNEISEIPGLIEDYLKNR